jgi:hypothetical protein
MRKRRLIGIVVLIVLSVLAAAILGVYRASQHVPEFYSKEVAIPASSQEEASDHMLKQATELQNALYRKGRWGQVFKAETINGWLAVDLPRNFPHLLPRGVHDPRVHIDSDGITMATQIERAGFHGVVSLEISAFIESDDVVGLQVHKARLGAIPVSLDRVMTGISEAAQRSNVQIRWRQSDGDPVALITIPAVGNRKQTVHIDTIRLEEGQLVVGGTTEPAPK